MSRHTAQTLASHLAASWSTAEKRKQRLFDLSLAREILDLDIGNYHIPARLIILLTARGSSEDIVRTIVPYLKTPVARENWPLAVGVASIHKSCVLDHFSSLIDPLENVVHRLSTLSISASLLQDDPSFATPFELVAVNRNAQQVKNANNQYVLELRPVRQRSHYVPNTNDSEPFDYLVELEVKPPLSKPRVLPASRPLPTIARSPRPVMEGPILNSNSLIKLGSRGPNAGRPDLRRRHLNSRSHPSNSSDALPNATNPSIQRRPSADSSNPVILNAATPSAAQRVADDGINQFVDLTLDTNGPPSLKRSLSPRDVIKPEYPEDSDYSLRTKDASRPTHQGPRISVENFRAKLNQRRASEGSKTMAFDNTDKTVLDPDSVFMRNQMHQKRASERAEKARQKREREAAREAASKDKAVERKRKRLSLLKKQPVASDDLSSDVKPETEKKEDDIIILDDIDDTVDRSLSAGVDRSPRRSSRSSTRAVDVDQHFESGRVDMVRREEVSEKRDRLFNSIKGHTDDLSDHDRKTIDDYFQGNNEIFGIQSSLLILLHHGCNGADHYIRLSREPRSLEVVKIFPS